MKKRLVGSLSLALAASATLLASPVFASTSKSTSVAAVKKADKAPAKADPQIVKRAILLAVGGSRVNGTATLTLDEKTHVLTVLVGVHGLVPKSSHPEHIHRGAKGPVIYPLSPIVANAKGLGAEITVIQGVQAIGSGWVVNIHRGPNLVGNHATVLTSGAVK